MSLHKIISFAFLSKPLKIDDTDQNVMDRQEGVL